MGDEIRVVELFAGVGGFRLGLERASDRFVTVWADQWEPGSKDQFAFRCYEAHYGDTPSVDVNADIAEVKGQVPDHDLLVGGFPCQDYSVAATNAKGIEGKKGVLWWHINDIVKARRPRYVLLENVDRLLKSPASQRGRDFGIILRCMADNGYSVEWRVVNAADYGCVQRRRRTFIFASRSDTAHYASLEGADPADVLTDGGFFARCFPVEADCPEPRAVDLGEGSFDTLVEVSDGFSADFGNAGYMTDHIARTTKVVPSYHGERRLLGDILDHDVDERYYQDGEVLDKWRYMKGPKSVERTSRSTGYVYRYTEGGIPFPDPLDRPGRTMLTSEGTVNRSSHLIMDPETGRYRKLTPSECEAMNGFEKGWTEGLTDRKRYFTMGNALVVDLIERMGREIEAIDSGAKASGRGRRAAPTLDDYRDVAGNRGH